MSHKIRLGPVALFLTVIAIVLTTLAVLTLASSNADVVMAERFAGVTKVRYDLESEGYRFVQRADEALKSGGSVASVPGVRSDGSGGYEYALEQDGYRLDIVVKPSGDSVEIVKWKITKVWVEDDPYKDIWAG
ncbi:MAG: hypothetical protein IKE27_08430 [Oscillospiraceae bacterium]|nr:hypothetical protein [Oscillospiraceae bacterium]